MREETIFNQPPLATHDKGIPLEDEHRKAVMVELHKVCDIKHKKDKAYWFAEYQHKIESLLDNPEVQSLAEARKYNEVATLILQKINEQDIAIHTRTRR